MAWICGQCKNLIDNHLSTCSQCGAPKSPTAFSGVGDIVESTPDSDYRDLAMEGHLKALALWYRIGGGIAFFFGLWMIIAGGGSSSHGSGLGRALGEVAFVIGIVIVLASAGGFVLGHFLGRFANGARITAGVFGAIGMASQLLNTCVGTFAGRRGPNVAALFSGVLSLGWSAAILWVLFNNRSSEICTPRYRELIARTPDMKPRTFQSPFFWVPLIIIGLGVGCGLIAVASLSSMRSY
jgi:hypothetical protein